MSASPSASYQGQLKPVEAAGHAHKHLRTKDTLIRTPSFHDCSADDYACVLLHSFPLRSELIFFAVSWTVSKNLRFGFIFSSFDS